MEIKICGMRSPENIRAVSALDIQFMGFIFYEKSPRFVTDSEFISSFKRAGKGVNKIGVFVDAAPIFVHQTVEKFNLDGVQFHGKETPKYLTDFRENFPSKYILKAFPISEGFDFVETKPYLSLADFFLFDTKTPQHGGAGLKFDWQILYNYKFETPFFLAGGISEDDAETIKSLEIKTLFALDLNSKFEIEPALKDVEKIKRFINKLI
jgi:phosphoribosylanthranilate isomerase